MALQLLIFILAFGSSLKLESVASRRIVGNETDRLSLLEFKKGISDPYESLFSWNSSIHFCNWVGITCGRRHRRVIRLDLEAKGLGGKISPTIGNLSFMYLINLANNSFHGEIPQEIGNLFRLQTIIFENNTLEGELPISLANCTRLIEISSQYNNLVGKFPVEFTSLSKLEWISINNNGLTGEIPASFGNMSSLRIISLYGNGLQGRIPESLSQLTKLQCLSLGINKLSGMFPLSIFNLSSLILISLPENQLQGSLPADISFTLPNLKFLLIGVNLFSGRIPSSISNMSTIKYLDLDHNSFVGPVPNNLGNGNLQNLQYFRIDDNQCGAEEGDDLDFVNSLLNCTNLEVLGLGFNGFKGPLPNFKANLSSQLSIFRIEGNQISGTIPNGIENLVNLTVLHLEQNFLEGIIPSGIGKLLKLQELNMSENRFSGQIPSSIGDLTILFALYLNANSLNATIPSSLGNCQQLQLLILDHNNLQGPIPKQLFHISSLSISLDLSHNSLTGSLPEEISNLKSLSSIDISKNRLSGEIPSSIGDCNSLEYLYMEGNFFEGVIPHSLTLLKGLQDLDLSYNNLSGQIPKDLENLSLQSLNLSFNNLEGEVPTKGIFGNASAIFMDGNDKLCGGIAELQLTPCTNHGSPKREKSHTFKIVLAIIGVVLGVLLISSFLTLYWIRKSKNKPASTPLIDNRFLKISYKELFQITEGFSSTNFIGSGSFGSVYKGIINQDETTIVAVKVLDLQNPRAYKSFMAECEALKNIRHRNLVKILTSCSSLDSKGKDFKALVYEFMPNGSLDDWLHLQMEAHSRSKNLNLLQRLNIAIDVASALDYLHYHCYPSIVHCDLKPSNILLDSDMTAHVSDFGLARLLLEPNGNSSECQTSTIGIKGSIGYAAPEYGMSGKTTIQGDVFSYGILLLEMFTGRRPTDQKFTNDLNLHKFVKTALPAQVMQVLDSTLLPKEGHDEEIEEAAIQKIEDPIKLQDCMMSIIEIALQCSMDSPRDRMNMNNVVKKLHLIKNSFGPWLQLLA